MDISKINTDKVKKKLVKFLKDEFKKRSFKKAVLGISGGVDSAVVASLASEALGPKNVYGIFMPYGGYEQDLKDVKELAAKTGINFKVIDISEMVDSYFKNFPDADKVLSSQDSLVVVADTRPHWS